MIRWFGEKLNKKYIEQGLLLGDILSSPYMGKPLGWEKTLSSYLILESKLIKKKYKPIPLIVFIDVSGWGKNIELKVEQGSEEEINYIYEINQKIINQYNDVTENFEDYYDVKSDGNVVTAILKDEKNK